MSEINLHTLISQYNRVNKQMKELEEKKKKLNAAIKMEFVNREISEYRTINNEVATVSTETRMTFNEQKAIDIIMNKYTEDVYNAFISMVPSINEEALADAIVKGVVDPSVVQESTDKKEVVRLTINDADKKSKPMSRTDDWGWGDK